VSEERAPLPEGYSWVAFEGGSLDGEWRIVRLPLEEDDDYEVVATGERWEWREGRFRIAPEAE
jgi:hypothetical protein